MYYRFEDFELDTSKRELIQNGAALKIEPQVYALLELLISNHEKVVSKADINTEIWNGREVSEGALSSRVYAARTTLGDNGTTQRLIKTIPNRGFMFIGKVEVKEVSVSQSSSSREMLSLPESKMDTSTLTNTASQSATAKPINKNQWRKYLPYGALAIAFCLVFVISTGRSPVSTPPNQRPQQSAPIATLTPEASIAVLPFIDMSPTGGQQYFGDGVAEEILNYLAARKSLKVSSRTSAFSFRDKDIQIGEIGQALGVKYVLEGSVRQSGDTLRITAQFIDSQSDQHVWSNTWDSVLADGNLFSAQEQIAQEIVGKVSEHLDLPKILLTSDSIPTQAKEAFLRANALRYRQTDVSLDSAIAEYKKSIAIAPNYANAYAALAITHSLTYRYQNKPLDDIIEAMKFNIAAADRLAPNLPELYVASAALALLENRYEDAISFSEQAIDLRPNYVEARHYKGDALMKLRRFAEAVIIYEEALSRDALSPDTLNRVAEAKIYTKDVDGALEAALANLHWNPKTSSALDMSSFLLWNQGNYKRAHELLLEAYKLTPNDFYVTSDLTYLYVDIDMQEAAEKIVQSDYDKAFFYALTGDKEQARFHLEQVPNSIENDETAYLLKDYPKASTWMDETLNAEQLLDAAPLRMTDGDWMAKVCFVYKQASNPNADKVCDKLTDFYEGTTPADFPMIEDIFGGAAWHMINNAPDQALIWIDYLIEKDMAFLKLTTQPVFAPLENHPDYEERLVRIEKNAAKHRRSILENLDQL